MKKKLKKLKIDLTNLRMIRTFHMRMSECTIGTMSDYVGEERDNRLENEAKGVSNNQVEERCVPPASLPAQRAGSYLSVLRPRGSTSLHTVELADHYL